MVWLVRVVSAHPNAKTSAFLYTISDNHDKMVSIIEIGGSMFQKLVREHPTLQDHWQDLLKKGYIENSKGSITLVRKYASDENVLIIKDAKNSILYTVKVGRLEVTRDPGSTNPNQYTFKVGDMAKLDNENLTEAFNEYEGFELALRDLYKTIDHIIEEHDQNKGLFYKFKKWFSVKNNRIFFIVALIYGILTAVVVFNHWY